MMSGRLWIRLTALVAIPSTLAAAEVQTFDVAFSAPVGCPESNDFVDQVLARTDRARVSTEAPEYRFTLKIADTPDGPRGELRIRGSDGSDSAREVPGEDCSSVVEAAALIAALLLDPHATTGPLVAPVTPLPAPSPKPDAPVPSEETNDRLPTADESSASARRATRARDWHFGVGVGPTVHGAIAPALTPGVSLGVRVAERGTSLFAPAVGMDGEFAASTASREAIGTASFTWLAVRTWACPVRFPSEPAAFGVRPCAFVDAGMLRAVGENTFQAQKQTAPWFAAGALGRLEWMASRSIAFELQGGAVFPAFRDRYLFLPDVVVHRVPPVGFLASFGVIFWAR